MDVGLTDAVEQVNRMQQRWESEPNGDLSATMRGLRLVIRNADSFARFLLLKRSWFGSRGEMLESGCEDSVSTAKAKAVERAMKLRATSAGGRNSRER